MSNDFVAMETNRCPVCGIEHSYNCGILLNKRMKKIKNTCSGISLCEEHSKQKEDGYIFLIEVDPDKSNPTTKGMLKEEEAYRTGNMMAIKKHVAEQVFHDKINTDIIFIDQDVFNRLEEWAKKEQAKL